MTYYRDFVLKIFDINALQSQQLKSTVGNQHSTDGIQKSCSTSDVISKNHFPFKSETTLSSSDATGRSNDDITRSSDVILKSASNGDVTSQLGFKPLEHQEKAGAIAKKSFDVSNRTADGILKPCSSHDDLGNGHHGVTEALLSKLEAVLARLVSDYRAIFAIEEEAASCGK